MSSPARRMAGLWLVAVTLLLRLPFVPAPTGFDAFLYQLQVRATLDTGALFWATQPASLWGLVPGTIPAGATTIVATGSVLTGLPLQEYLLLHSPLLALLGTAGFWLLAGEVGGGNRGRWLAALAFAVAPRYLQFSHWRISLRYMLVVLLPLFLWLLLRIQHVRYGRHPARLVCLALVLGLLLPTVHRMGLLLPGFLLAFALAWALHHWQEGALDRQRAGRQALLALVFIGSYLFYLAWKGLSPHTPSEGLFEIYLFQGDSLLMQVANLMVHYGMRGGPLLLLALVAGGQLWQQGRQSLGIWLALAALALGLFIALDHTYLTFILLVPLLLLVASGVQPLLQGSRRRQALALAALALLGANFAYLDLRYQVDNHAQPQVFFSSNLRPTSIGAGLWGTEQASGAIFESNDHMRTRRVASQSNMVPLVDGEMLVLGAVQPESQQLVYRGWQVMYWEVHDHLWVLENQAALEQNLSQNRSLSLVNLAFPEASGQSHIPETISANQHYRWLDWFAYRTYANSELAFYYSAGY
ncbi:MAG: hypothetical protein QF459_05150 [Candidatus Poseidoniia archaeon]|nr:hypothetical protein [Candidatus Poseidoniia archaeon]MDP7589303.1 hypothetical protein [Candidatus Poseidoniia archaeon]